MLDGELFLAGMPRSVTLADLRRDPRLALHSGSDGPDAFTADAKVSGRAVEVRDPQELTALAGSAEVPEEARPSNCSTWTSSRWSSAPGVRERN